MKAATLKLKPCIVTLVLLPLVLGCEPTHRARPGFGSGYDPNIPLCLYYSPVKVQILPLTEFAAGDQGTFHIDAWVSLLDSAASQVKSPGRFRFELYERVQRSAEPKGTRLKIWHDFDLYEPAENNLYWQDYLRAYRFFLPFDPEPGKDYILEVTCMTAVGKRLTSAVPLTYSP